MISIIVTSVITINTDTNTNT